MTTHTRILSRLFLPLALSLSTSVCAESPRHRALPVSPSEAANTTPVDAVEPMAPVDPVESTALLDAPDAPDAVETGTPTEPVAVTARAVDTFDHTHAAWTAILSQNVRGTNFNYGGLKKSRGAFDEYLEVLQGVTPEELKKWSKDQRFAFWINAYNAHTILKVIDNYPLKSIRKLDTAFGLNSVFDKEFIPMSAHHPEGKQDELALNHIEHGILRAQFKDARLHAAINCASISCPPLLNEAFTAEKLDAQLTSQMRAFVNDPTRNEINPAKKRMRISEIFKWFKDDFVRDAGSVNEYLSRYVSEDIKGFVGESRFGYLDYDWDLNDARESS